MLETAQPTACGHDVEVIGSHQLCRLARLVGVYREVSVDYYPGIAMSPFRCARPARPWISRQENPGYIVQRIACGTCDEGAQILPCLGLTISSCVWSS